MDLIIGCGDLSYAYLEYVMNALDVPLYFVRGNHDVVVERTQDTARSAPSGGVDLHRRATRYNGLLLAGVEGSLRYRPGYFQYSQAEMWTHVFSLVPSLIANRMYRGRYLDLFVTHAPAEGIHDMPDLPHQGIRAFRWLIRVFKPAYYLHGHIHIYSPETAVETRVDSTLVINTFGYRETMMNQAGAASK